MEKRLYRSKRYSVIAGVCGGFAEYFNIDPIITRILWIALSLASLGTGVIIYVIAAIIMPEDKGSFGNTGNQQDSTGYEGFNPAAGDWKEPPKFDAEKSRNVIGIGLIVIGVLFLMKQVFHWFDTRLFWPLLIIGIGALIIYRGRRNSV